MSASQQAAVHQLARQAVNQTAASRNQPKATNQSEPAKQIKKLAKAASTSQQPLFEANTVFPFTLFPDTIKIDRDKLMVIRREFFGVATVSNIQLHDIQAIEANTGPFLGSLKITAQRYTNKVTSVKFLSRDSVIKAQRLLQGFVIAHEKKIDYSQVENDKLMYFIENIGYGDTR